MSKLYVLTLNWNGGDKLEILYPGLLNNLNEINKLGVDWEWLIRDNGSQDNSLNVINSWKDSKVKTFKMSHNKDNYSQGNNYLFHQAQPQDDDFILLLNNDIAFFSDTSLHQMLKLIQNDSKIGIVGAKLNYLDRPKVLQHAGVVWHSGGLQTPINFKAGQIENFVDSSNRYFPMVTGACLLTRASIYRQLSGLDEGYYFCWEDCDFCLKVKEVGYEVVYCGQVSIAHEESASLKKNPINKLFFSQNTKKFMDRWRSQIEPDLAEKYKNDFSFMLYRKGK